VPEGLEWYVDKIISHHWKGRNMEFLGKWNLGVPHGSPYPTAMSWRLLIII